MKKLLILTVACLTACSPVTIPTRQMYTLETPSNVDLKERRPVSIIVSPVQSAPAYKGREMIYVEKDFQLKAFARNEWAAPPAQMLTPLLVESLRNTHSFRAIIAPPSIDKADYRLDVNLLSFQHQFLKKPSEVEVVMTAQMMNLSTRRAVATERFVVREVSRSNDPYGGVLAANLAVQKALGQIATFCVSSAKS